MQRAKRLFAGFVLLVLAVAAKADAQTGPNFVVILTDDQGYGDLGCYGSETIKTPNIDRMAREGMRFTTFYAAAPICTPTRAGLMTGCYATRVGLTTPLHVYDEVGLNPSEVTLAETMQKAGYRTGCVGKWHLGHRPQDYPTRHGFDEYWGTPLGHMFNRPAEGKAVGDTFDLFLEGETVIPMPANEDLTERTTERAMKFISDHKDRPFFLFIAHSMPHEPLAVSPKFAGKSKGGLYGDVVECIDWSCGQILDSLQKNRLTEKTIVLYMSDNGPEKKSGASAGKLRGFKHDPYEGGVRVPFIAYGPGFVLPGRTVDAMMSAMDVYPSLAAIAGTSPPTGQATDGMDLSGLLLGKPDPSTQRKDFFYFIRYGELVGVRQDNWKLLQTKKAELFDLKEDPYEKRNVAAQHPDIVQRLGARQAEFQKEIDRTKRSPAGAYRPIAPRKDD